MSGAPRQPELAALPIPLEAVAASPADPPLLVIIVPAYNEAETIAQTIESLRAFASRVSNVRIRIFVVNDGSIDETAKRATAAGVDRLVTHKVNRGLGAAVRSGLHAARVAGADIAVKFDADGQHEATDIAALIEPVLRDEADIVYGDRFGRIEYKMPFVRRLGNTVFTGLMAWLTKWPLRDSQPGIFAVQRTYLERFYIPGDYNYTQQILLDAYHLGLRFDHVPVAFRPRTKGTSFVSLKYPFKVIPQLVMVLVGIRPMRIFGPIGALFLIIAVALFGVEFVEWLQGHAPKPVVHVNALLGCLTLGLHTLFFGLIADLIVRFHRRGDRS
jgi:glycosyltransferase involved in cell wall biosynthesis